MKLAFLGTSRSGLGHLRRISSVARAVRAVSEDVEPFLITNAEPAGLSAEDFAAFTAVLVRQRTEMAQALAGGRFDLAVLDTLHLPGISAFSGPAVLILRETPDERISEFRRDDGRPWDRVIVPNPAAHWVPAVGDAFSRSVETVGWIRRAAGMRRGRDKAEGIVVATGGGGTVATRAQLFPLLDGVIAEARRRASRPVRIRQALGPRSGGAALSESDEVFDPGATLNEVFRDADLVISTAGYNSVLELATTDTPVLLAGIPRSLDDQAARVRLWGARLGHGLDPGAPERAAAWLAGQFDRPRRRPPVDLGPDGSARAAELILEVLCPAS